MLGQIPKQKNLDCDDRLISRGSSKKIIAEEEQKKYLQARYNCEDSWNLMEKRREENATSKVEEASSKQ